MATQAVLLGAAGSCTAAALVAAWRDRRRTCRYDPDAVGIVDWRTVQLAAIGAALVLIVLAIKQ
ncbi:hypothetical protein [Sphingomonas sp. TZW2008]|uniref:hypothetical protein n=1 Tax=Sphingomonas sp. TZW2008 TaxID=1917973 RepID=UPI000A26E036|nr:hypothetical protein [Sphingomonas sp. TZW2008]